MIPTFLLISEYAIIYIIQHQQVCFTVINFTNIELFSLDIGGLDKQIQELIEAVVLPMTHAERFEALGIKAPKGVLLYGPPGTGKTLLVRHHLC